MAELRRIRSNVDDFIQTRRALADLDNNVRMVAAGETSGDFVDLEITGELTIDALSGVLQATAGLVAGDADFVDLGDTPADYTGGVGDYIVKVNAGATGLEFAATAPPGAHTHPLTEIEQSSATADNAFIKWSGANWVVHDLLSTANTWDADQLYATTTKTTYRSANNWVNSSAADTLSCNGNVSVEFSIATTPIAYVASGGLFPAALAKTLGSSGAPWDYTYTDEARITLLAGAAAGALYADASGDVKAVAISGAASPSYLQHSGGALSWSATAAPGAHTHVLTDVTDVTATFGEVNLLDLAGLGVGDVLTATGATSAEWRSPRDSSLYSWHVREEFFTKDIRSSQFLKFKTVGSDPVIERASAGKVTDEHIGVWKFTSGDDGGPPYSFSSCYSLDSVLIQGGEHFRAIVHVDTLASDYYRIRAGLMQTGEGANVDANDWDHGIWLEFDHVSSANWYGWTGDGIGTDSVDISVAAANQWHLLEFVVNAAGTEVDFYVDDPTHASPANVNSRVPIGKVGFVFMISTNFGAIGGPWICHLDLLEAWSNSLDGARHD